MDRPDTTPPSPPPSDVPAPPLTVEGLQALVPPGTTERRRAYRHLLDHLAELERG